LICDTTSLSSFSGKLNVAEFGYNRDCESLPQVNLIMIHARETGLPLSWRMVPGSVPDVATLRNTAAFLSEYGLKEFSFALDKGFCSKANMRELSANGLSFVLGVPFNSRWAEDFLKRKRIKLESMKRMFSFDGRELHHVSETMELEAGKATKLKLAAHLFLDPLRRQDMLASFKRRVMAVEEKASNEIFNSRYEAVEWLKENGAGAGHCLLVNGFQGTAKIVHSPMRMARASSAMGYNLIASSDTSLSREQVLSDYRSRDAVEKLFDSLKNELGSGRLRTGKEDSANGRLLVDFIALVLRKALENSLRKTGLSKSLSVPEALDELEKVKAVVMADGRRIVLEIPSKAKGIIKAAGAPLLS
jgi:transposase